MNALVLQRIHHRDAVDTKLSANRRQRGTLAIAMLRTAARSIRYFAAISSDPAQPARHQRLLLTWFRSGSSSYPVSGPQSTTRSSRRWRRPGPTNRLGLLPTA